MDNPSLKDTKEGASAKRTEREFHNGTVCGKKLNLKESVDGAKCLYLLEWVDLVLVVEGVRYWSAGMSIKWCITLKKRVS